MCTFESIYGRYPECDNNCIECGFNFDPHTMKKDLKHNIINNLIENKITEKEKRLNDLNTSDLRNIIETYAIIAEEYNLPELTFDDFSEFLGEEDIKHDYM